MPTDAHRTVFARLVWRVALVLTPFALNAQARPWSAAPPDSTRLLSKGLGYGSDAYNSPVTVLLNKGYDIFQLRHSPRNITTFPYRNAWHYGIRRVVQHPGEAIERFGGWGRFTRVELLPLSVQRDELNWFVNYTEHLFGGGLTMRLLDDWYRARGVPQARLLAAVTTYAASALNEISEQPDIRQSSAGGVSDLIFFDLGAVLLFHWDQPVHFLATTLQVADWSNQATVTLPNRQLQNNGQYFTFKVPIGLADTRVFVRGGMGAQIGISQRVRDYDHVSFGLGGDTDVREIDERGHETVSFAPSAGVYYDRNNSLLWSVTASPAENVIAANVFPGVLPGIAREAGLWLVRTRRDEWRVGIVFRRAAGLGIGYGR